MPNTSYEDDLLVLMGSQEPSEIIIDTLELSHSNFTKTYYLNNYGKDFTGNIPGPTIFEPVGIKVTLPTQNENGREDAHIILDAVDRIVLNEIRLAIQTFNEPIVATHRFFIENNPEPQTKIPFVFKIFSLSYENYQVIATGNLPQFNNYKFPRNIYTIKEFPALQDL